PAAERRTRRIPAASWPRAEACPGRAEPSPSLRIRPGRGRAGALEQKRHRGRLTPQAQYQRGDLHHQCRAESATLLRRDLDAWAGGVLLQHAGAHRLGGHTVLPNPRSEALSATLLAARPRLTRAHGPPRSGAWPA